MSITLNSHKISQNFLDNPSKFVTSLRSLRADQPPLIVTGHLHELPKKMRDQYFHGFLSSEEQSRASSFHRISDYQRFTNARIVIRLILGCWLSVKPSSVIITQSPYGKPGCQHAPFFNISHSEKYIVLAMHPLKPVGIDIERIRHYEKWKEIAAIVWPDTMIKEIESFCDHKQSQEFLNQWCRYEAITKAFGLGLSTPISKIASMKSCKHWRLSLPENYIGYAAMIN